MTVKTKDEPRTNTPRKENRFYLFVTEMQKTREIDQLFGLFLQQLHALHLGGIKQAELAYRGGILSESLTFRPPKPGITRSSINRESFPDTDQDYIFTSTREKFVMFNRVDGSCIHMVLQNKKTAPPRIPRKEKKLVELAHVFFNQVFLLSKIKNFEFHSIKDDITLAYNQKYLKTFMQNEIERSRRYSSVFSVIFFDLDNLKAVNEKHGHLIGTEVLKEVATVLRAQVRAIDLLSRFGGDEFVIVLLHADARASYEVCTRIRAALRNTLFLKDKGLEIKITGCFGISGFPKNGNTADDLIRKADIAMYEIKHMGKDGIKIYEGDE